MRDVLASYHRFVCVIERVKYFLQRLDAYTRIPLTPAMTELLAKIMAQVLSILALSTKEMQEKQISALASFGIIYSLRLIGHEIERSLKRLLGRKDIEDALQRLNVLTGEELRMAVAKILEVAHRVDRNVAVVAKETRGVGNRITRVEAATRNVNRNMQATYAGVSCSLHLFINVLTVS
jgi:hypothetical protein